ncbi:MAG: hypothetical protein A4E47_00316 [Methanosaeta sp. PtaU1.Bin028]|nr:MAG: hypothetical protein A4E47_00316 [Methanosaeta sp. PtaU1.Bin028]
MAFRLVELIVPGRERETIEEALKDDSLKGHGIWVQGIEGIWEYPVQGMWEKRFYQDHILVRVLLKAEETEAWVDAFSQRLSGVEGFRLFILPVEASLPRPATENDGKHISASPTNAASSALSRIRARWGNGTESQQADGGARSGRLPSRPRLSREELYFAVQESTHLDQIYLLTVFLSSIVAAIGLLSNNVAVVIGAMVIAPLLGPNVAMSLATTLGDKELAFRAARTNLFGLAFVMMLSVLLGMVLNVDPSTTELASRTRVGMADVVLALASGSAGALAFTAGVSATLIGVMVAVALLPPLVSAGLLYGSGNSTLAAGAVVLFLVNLICINLAGVATFLYQGIRPSDWQQKQLATKASWTAILLWLLLLSMLIALIIYSESFMGQGQ